MAKGPFLLLLGVAAVLATDECHGGGAEVGCYVGCRGQPRSCPALPQARGRPGLLVPEGLHPSLSGLTHSGLFSNAAWLLPAALAAAALAAALATPRTTTTIAVTTPVD